MSPDRISIDYSAVVNEVILPVKVTFENLPWISHDKYLPIYYWLLDIINLCNENTTDVKIQNK